MATIKQIAQKAGVSAATVSNVLHGRTEKVSQKTLETVRFVLDEENYSPNLAAQLLAHKKSHIIGVIIYHVPRAGESMFEDPFISVVLGAFEEEIRKNGYYMMVHVSDNEKDVLRLAKSWKLDGLLILWLYRDTTKALLQSTETPVVFFDNHFDEDENGEKIDGFYNVGLDDFRGGYEATKHLIDMGHKKIAILCDAATPVGGYKWRHDGYKKALADAGLIFEKDNMIFLSLDKQDRFKTYERLYTTQKDFTALFFLADYYAAEAISFFQKNDIQIPEIFSVVGFDDNIYAKIVHPNITSVHQNTFERGKVAVDMLLKLIKGDSVEKNNLKMDITLKLRDSVKKIS